MSTITEKYRNNIAHRVKELRKKGRLTQGELAAYLGLSQNRISQLEAGQGSFLAEHLILLAKKFNVPVTSFVSEPATTSASVQNTLARFGASHLGESEDVLPSEQLNDVIRVVLSVLFNPASPRHVTALAPVLIQHANPALLNVLRLQTQGDLFLRRYQWLLENIRWALAKELSENLEREQRVRYKRVDLIIENLLKVHWFGVLNPRPIQDEDIFDPDIASPQTLNAVRESSSDISKRLKIVTRIQPEDFQKAIKDARETN